MIKTVSAQEFMIDYHKPDYSKVSESVREIIQDVKTRGDEAIREYTKKFDNLELEKFELTEEEIDGALNKVNDGFKAMLLRASNNIRGFHSRQLRNGFVISERDGVIMGQRVIPLGRVGLYIPGGTASYPSTVLMNAIPAKIAGCKEICMATPPKFRPEIIAAAKISGVDRIFTIGGAVAVASFAYGTESVPRVDKITGPGNIYVAEAKRQVFGDVGIDMIAGPSEILIVADKNNHASHIAADMLAQAEHDTLATSILITNSKILARNVEYEIESQIDTLERRDIARQSIDNNGRIILVRTLEQSIEIVNEIAPEHLELCVENPFEWLTCGRIVNAGSIFLGRHSPEALGDYYAGINHTLPTMRTARFSSPLSVDDFIKKSQFVYYSEKALHDVSRDIEMFATLEGLTAHARSITIRRDYK